MSDWTRAKKKSREGVEFIDYANVPMGDETFELAYGLLSGDDFLDIYGRMDIQTIREYQDESDTNERLQELQSKDELTDDEEDELQDLHEEVTEESAELISRLGDDTLSAIQDAGRLALRPDREDINDALELSSAEQEERFGETLRTPQEAREAIETEMREVVKESPYLIAWTIGQKAFEESQRLVGN